MTKAHFLPTISTSDIPDMGNIFPKDFTVTRDTPPNSTALDLASRELVCSALFRALLEKACNCPEGRDYDMIVPMQGLLTKDKKVVGVHMTRYELTDGLYAETNPCGSRTPSPRSIRCSPDDMEHKVASDSRKERENTYTDDLIRSGIGFIAALRWFIMDDDASARNIAHCQDGKIIFDFDRAGIGIEEYPTHFQVKKDIGKILYDHNHCSQGLNQLLESCHIRIEDPDRPQPTKKNGNKEWLRDCEKGKESHTVPCIKKDSTQYKTLKEQVMFALSLVSKHGETILKQITDEINKLLLPYDANEPASDLATRLTLRSNKIKETLFRRKVNVKRFQTELENHLEKPGLFQNRTVKPPAQRPLDEVSQVNASADARRPLYTG